MISILFTPRFRRGGVLTDWVSEPLVIEKLVLSHEALMSCGNDRLSRRKFEIVCHGKVRIPLEGDEILVEFRVDLVPGATPVAKSPYRLAPLEMQELSEQLQELQDKAKLRRVRAMSMIIQSSVKNKILATPSETSKVQVLMFRSFERYAAMRTLLWAGKVVIDEISMEDTVDNHDLAGVGDFVEFISFTFGDKEMILVFWLFALIVSNFLVWQTDPIGTVLKFDFLRSTCACKWLLRIIDDEVKVLVGLDEDPFDFYTIEVVVPAKPVAHVNAYPFAS
ncbi:hypothetical protein Tco_0924649 [Tanacetum coccineum]|uniref:Reverse transcriptase domain-containing protein n=1 Tax=Tanacetum coccineum TaxID=301880 RepID=A0ABQ5D4J5_9ASTR